jgi:hypothetical protein
VAGFSKHVYETSSSIKAMKFLAGEMSTIIIGKTLMAYSTRLSVSQNFCCAESCGDQKLTVAKPRLVLIKSNRKQRRYVV